MVGVDLKTLTGWRRAKFQKNYPPSILAPKENLARDQKKMSRMFSEPTKNMLHGEENMMHTFPERKNTQCMKGLHMKYMFIPNHPAHSPQK